MPTYNYKCRECENEFEKTISMSEREKETQKPCAHCNGEIYQKIGTSNLSFSGHNVKHSNDFNDRLKDMRKNLPKGKMPIDNIIH